jgi:RNA polymerase sigma factor (sigma-70 family)
LQAVLDRLSLTEREMVKLRFEQGLKLEEIARRLGITYAAAAQRLSRAIHHARELG